MAEPKPVVVVTGAAGNLGVRLLPLLTDFTVVAVDVNAPPRQFAVEFERMDLGQESAREALVALLLKTKAASLVHLAFIIDPVRMGVLDVDRMWQINVGGTGRVVDAIAQVNRSGENVKQFIYPSSVSVYGPDLPGPVTEEYPKGAHTLPYAIHKREAEDLINAKAGGLGECSVYVLRPHIYAGASVDNYLIGALRGTPTGRGKIGQSWRRKGIRLPLVIPFGSEYPDKQFQFVHVDDVARLIAWIVRRPWAGRETVVLNVPGRGAALTLRQCVQMANATVIRLPSRALCRSVLQLMWKLGICGVPPEALPYMIGSYTMDSRRLRVFLGGDYENVVRFTVEEALADSFRETAGATTAPAMTASPPS